VTSDAFYAALRQMGLSPRAHGGTETHMICDTRRPGEVQMVPRPEQLRPAEREDAITLLRWRLGSDMPNYGSHH
jgi:hypothetical protein